MRLISIPIEILGIPIQSLADCSSCKPRRSRVEFFKAKATWLIVQLKCHNRRIASIRSREHDPPDCRIDGGKAPSKFPFTRPLCDRSSPVISMRQIPHSVVRNSCDLPPENPRSMACARHVQSSPGFSSWCAEGVKRKGTSRLQRSSQPQARRLSPRQSPPPAASEPRSSGRAFVDEKKEVPAGLEWNKQVGSRLGGAISFRVDSQGPFGVTVVTDEAHKAIMAGVKRPMTKASVMLVADAEGPTYEGKVTIPSGFSYIILENRSKKSVEFHLQCFPGS
jgi:hypothetical protein